MSEIATVATVAGVWIATNYLPILSSISSVGGPVIVKKYILKPLLKKRNIKKLIKYLTDDEQTEELLKVLFTYVKDLDHTTVFKFKNRIKTYRKQFKKIDFKDASEKLLSTLFDALKEDKTFIEYTEKINLINNINDILIVLRNHSNSEIRKTIVKELLDLLIDLNLSEIKALMYYIESQKHVFTTAMTYDDVIGHLELNLEYNSHKETVIHLARKVFFDVERRYCVQVCIDRSPSASNENVDTSTTSTVLKPQQTQGKFGKYR